jgi:6-oxo-cyclohex-1-ene-carbonyl-CoA hydrolase
MMTEARAGFRAFNEGTRETGREIDFIALRRALAANERWSDGLTESVMPGAMQRRTLIGAMPWTDPQAVGAGAP